MRGRKAVVIIGKGPAPGDGSFPGKAAEIDTVNIQGKALHFTEAMEERFKINKQHDIIHFPREHFFLAFIIDQETNKKTDNGIVSIS